MKEDGIATKRHGKKMETQTREHEEREKARKHELKSKSKICFNHASSHTGGLDIWAAAGTSLYWEHCSYFTEEMDIFRRRTRRYCHFLLETEYHSLLAKYCLLHSLFGYYLYDYNNTLSGVSVELGWARLHSCLILYLEHRYRQFLQ